MVAVGLVSFGTTASKHTHMAAVLQDMLIFIFGLLGNRYCTTAVALLARLCTSQTAVFLYELIYNSSTIRRPRFQNLALRSCRPKPKAYTYEM